MSEQSETGPGESSAVVAEASALSRMHSQGFSEEQELELEPQGPEGEIGVGYQGLPLYSGGIGIPNVKRLVSKPSEHQVVTSSRVCSGSRSKGCGKEQRGAEQDQRRRGELILNHKEALRAGRHSTQ